MVFPISKWGYYNNQGTWKLFWNGNVLNQSWHIMINRRRLNAAYQSEKIKRNFKAATFTQITDDFHLLIQMVPLMHNNVANLNTYFSYNVKYVKVFFSEGKQHEIN